MLAATLNAGCDKHLLQARPAESLSLTVGNNQSFRQEALTYIIPFHTMKKKKLSVKVLSTNEIAAS